MPSLACGFYTYRPREGTQTLTTATFFFAYFSYARRHVMWIAHVQKSLTSFLVRWGSFGHLCWLAWVKSWRCGLVVLEWYMIWTFPFFKITTPLFCCRKTEKLSTHCFLDCQKRWPPWVGLSLLSSSNLKSQNFIVHELACHKNNAFCFHMQVNQRWRWKKDLGMVENIWIKKTPLK